MRNGHPFCGKMAVEAGKREWDVISPDEAECCAMSDYLVIGGWSGRRKIPVNVIGETPDGYEIKALESAFIPGRGTLRAGQLAVVPKAIVKLEAR
jgi:hypothetical protein